MKTFFTTKTGRLRLLGFLEGSSLLFLLFIGMPSKHLFNNPEITRMAGSIHGALFVLFFLNVLSTALEQNWSFRNLTWKVLLASFLPFGTFYIDRNPFKKPSFSKIMKAFLIIGIVLLALYASYKTYRYATLSKGLDTEMANGAVILDVRTETEFQTGHIKGSLNISLGTLRQRYKELDPNNTYYRMFPRPAQRKGRRPA